MTKINAENDILAGMAFVDKPFASVPYLDQYTGAWAIEESTFSLLAQRVQALDVTAHLNSEASIQVRNLGLDAAEALIQKSGGVGVLNLQGVLMKQASSVTGGTSTVLARRALRMLLADDEVQSILLKIESPGGTAAGTQQFANDIRAATKIKPTVAYIEDLGASAAYWLASQASAIYANEPAKVGSIGAYLVVHDLSGKAAQEGVKVFVIKAGEHKGGGVPGTEVTPDQLADLQRIIDGVNSFFLTAVAQGRSMSPDAVKTLADGRVHFATEAMQLGLIDGVESFEETLARVRGQSSTSTNRNRRMSNETQTAASVSEIKANCPGINSDKVLEFAEQSKSLEQCKDSWMQELATENAALAEQNAKLTADLEAKESAEKQREQELAASSVGVDALEHSPSRLSTEGDSAAEQFQSLVKAKMEKGLTREKALVAVVKSDPEIHRAMITEVNAGRKRR